MRLGAAIAEEAGGREIDCARGCVPVFLRMWGTMGRAPRHAFPHGLGAPTQQLWLDTRPVPNACGRGVPAVARPGLPNTRASHVLHLRVSGA